MRSLGCALIYYDWYPYERGHLDPETSREGRCHRDTRRRLAISREETQNSDGPNPAHTLILHFLPSELWHNTLLLLKNTQFMILCGGHPSQKGFLEPSGLPTYTGTPQCFWQLVIQLLTLLSPMTVNKATPGREGLSTTGHTCCKEVLCLEPLRAHYNCYKPRKKIKHDILLLWKKLLIPN